jgi:O-methyltransferase
VLVAGSCPSCKREIKGATTLFSMRYLHYRHALELLEDVPGDIVECGVGRGKSLFMLAVLTERHRHPRRLWGFDSFQGLPEPSVFDEPDRAPERIKAGMYAFSEDKVRSYLIDRGISESTLAERFVFVEGYFPASFPKYTGDQIALLHLDVDLYQSFKDCLEWFEPRVAPGGVIAFDDYRTKDWPGATRAIEEYYGGRPPRIEKSPYSKRGWFLTKT